MREQNYAHHMIVVLLSLLITGHAFGQRQVVGARARAGAGGAMDRDTVRVRKLEWYDGDSEIETPQYDSTAARGVTRPGVWRQFIVEYETREEWVDELTFEFHVLALGKSEGKRVYSYYTTRVSYIDVPKDRDHMATVFLRPNTIERYGVPVAFGVEIYHKGKMVAQETEARTKLSKTWWKDPNVMDSALVKKREKYLLNRGLTPFALVDVDAYQTIKP
ncbi:MAG: hypothetical protein QGH42_03660 [Kiritimatiellia bacterium]|jgi:hypothetical protein|nr:hypothetical protein [Kiritimatiellia bacterium]MDP6810682.1 hypothetical protein [Kiritimatiellia bacterium]MDP7023331.1 hypothetical protein [Kiritimatiellia bacterium]